MQHDRPYFAVRDGESREPPTLPRQRTAGASYCVRFFVPLRMSGSGEPHTLRAADVWPLDIRIRNVSGVAFTGTVPGPEVRLTNDRVGTGTLEVEVAAHGVGPESDWLEEPPVIDVTPANEPLLRSFREGRLTLR